MPNSEWAPLVSAHRGQPVDARPGPHLSRRRFVSLAMYTSAAVVLSAAVPSGVLAATSVDSLARQRECMPALPSPEAPQDVLAFADLEELHLRYRGALPAEVDP